MNRHVEERLARFIRAGEAPLLKEIRAGLEKEGLRVDVNGRIAQTPHPPALGSALLNPHITTDYSEALLELVSPPCDEIDSALAFLHDTHAFVYQHLEHREFIWSASMPCILAGEESIPVAWYGTSNAGNMKRIYRVGLGYRYGRVMQTIAGIHFNFSFKDTFWEAFRRHEGVDLSLREFKDERYFGLIRNLLRVGWLIPYLFGDSPAVCRSFLGGKRSSLDTFDESTYYGPYATSLRMGDIGYQNNKENEIGVKACYDNLDAYVATLTHAIQTPYPGYERFGVRVEGHYRQLNANILQIENEYYSTVRPKQPPEWNERPTVALKRRGVSYIELRSLDVNPYEPLGVGEPQLRFIHALMLLALFQESPPIRPWERTEIDRNELDAAHRGREPGLKLMRNGDEVELREWALEVCEQLIPICRALDAAEGRERYGAALAEQRAAVEDPGRLPSARTLAEMRERGESFHGFARRMSAQHQRYFKAQSLEPERLSFFAELAARSLREQREMEQGETLSFEEFLASYFEQRV